MGEGVQIRARAIRGLVAVLCSAAIAVPDVAQAGPAASSGPDLKAVETAFTEGMAAYERGDYAIARWTWSAAAALLPETPEHRSNRVALFELMVKAYQKELERVADDPAASEAVARDAVTTLDEYAQGLATAAPSEPLSPAIADMREQARAIVTAADEARKAAEPPPPPPMEEPPPPPPSKPWKPLAIGGGVALAGGAAMLAMFGVGFARAKKFEGQFDDPDHGCDVDDVEGACADYDKKGRASNGLAVAGLVAGPLLLGAGVALLVVATRRKKAATNRSLSPVWSPTMAGFVYQQRF